MFEGRKLLIATQHGKEKVIAPIFKKYFNIQSIVNNAFDTDSLGTFSGEIERKLDVIATLRQKCLLAAEHHKIDLILASEGSFGSHPTLYFCAADDEFVMLSDLKNNLEIIARELSTATNFGGENITTENQLLTFAENSFFPTHALILKSSEKKPKIIYKGIQNETDLLEKFHYLKVTYPEVFVETDMRAHLNPSRMTIIEKATHKLVAKMQTCCPNCKTPGFDISEVIEGLPCEQCKCPTKSTLAWVYQCKKCAFKTEEKFPHKKQFEDPMYCDFCNP